MAGLVPPRAGADAPPRPLLRGDEIRQLQTRLATHGFHPGKPDGIYGPQTESAVAAFQAAQGLLVDGEAGPATQAALRAKP